MNQKVINALQKLAYNQNEYQRSPAELGAFVTLPDQTEERIKRENLVKAAPEMVSYIPGEYKTPYFPFRGVSRDPRYQDADVDANYWTLGPYKKGDKISKGQHIYEDMASEDWARRIEAAKIKKANADMADRTIVGRGLPTDKSQYTENDWNKYRWQKFNNAMLQRGRIAKENWQTLKYLPGSLKDTVTRGVRDIGNTVGGWFK